MRQGRRPVAVLAILAGTLLLSGCGEKEGRRPEGIDTLPYLQHTHHVQLRQEYQRLLAEQTLPRQLGDVIVDGQSVQQRAVQLAEQLDKLLTHQNVRLALESIELFYPQQKFQFDPIGLQKARASLRRHADHLAQYRQLLQQPDFAFYLPICDGLLADLSVLDHAQLAHRLEALAAADTLAAGQTAAVVSSLRNMLRIDARLSQLPSVAGRSTAALLRSEALQVAAALVEHPQYDSTRHQQLSVLLQEQLRQWPRDRVAWVGDRALGMHTYELVRDGKLMSILTKKEIDELQEAGNLQAFDLAVLASIDEDQWFYLSAMRRVIDVCDQPYYQRLATFEQISQEAQQLEGTPRSPLLAVNVLLRDMAEVQRALALDQALCEAWCVAASAATGAQVDGPAQTPSPAGPTISSGNRIRSWSVTCWEIRTNASRWRSPSSRIARARPARNGRNCHVPLALPALSGPAAFHLQQFYPAGQRYTSWQSTQDRLSAVSAVPAAAASPSRAALARLLPACSSAVANARYSSSSASSMPSCSRVCAITAVS